MVRTAGRLRALLCAWMALALMTGCQEGTPPEETGAGETTGDEDLGPDLSDCVEFEVLDGFATTPSNIMLFFGLQTCEGEPILGIQEEHFVIEESGKPISLFESNLTVLPRCTGFDFVSVLLLDVSGSIVHSGSLPSLQEAAKAFIGQLTSEFQVVSVHLFDGRPDLELLVDFTTDKTVLFDAIDSLSSYEVVDKSTNLNGAVLNGLTVLDERQVSAENVLLQEGSLVVFTDGTDQAGLVDDASASEAVAGSAHRVFTIGLGAEIDTKHLATIGKTAAVFPNSTGDISSAFNSVGDEILIASQRYYVIGYCSPKRSGDHELRLEIAGYHGVMKGFFNADHFGPGCDDVSIVETANLTAKACADTTVFSGTGQFFD